MSEAWINRLWQLVLVCTFAIVLSVCNKALDETTESGTGSPVGTAFADGPVTISAMPKVEVESTATVSSMPTIKTDITSMPSQTVEILAGPKVVLDNSSSIAVSSIPSVNVASQALSTISHMIICRGYPFYENEVIYFRFCDSTDDTTLITKSLDGDNTPSVISLADLSNAGFKICPSNPFTGDAESNIFCK